MNNERTCVVVKNLRETWRLEMADGAWRNERSRRAGGPSETMKDHVEVFPCSVHPVIVCGTSIDVMDCRGCWILNVHDW